MGCLRRLTGCLFALVIAVVVLAVGAYLLLLYVMDNELSDTLRRKFMLPPSSQVTIEPGDIQDSFAGRVHSVRIEASEASISGIRVQDLTFYAEDLSFDIMNLLARRNPVLREVEYAKAAFKVSPEDLAAAWLKRARRFGVQELTVEFAEDLEEELPQITVTAQTRLLGKNISASAQGHFKLVDGREIAFATDKFELEKLNLGRDLAETLFESMAPRLRIGDFQGDLLVDRFYVKDGELHVAAHTTGVADLSESENNPPEEAN